MAVTNFTTWTELDPTSKITIDSATHVSCAGLETQTDAMVYKVFDPATFGNFTHYFTAKMSAYSEGNACLGIYNISNDTGANQYDESNGIHVYFWGGNTKTDIWFEDLDTGKYDNVGEILDVNTQYWFTVSRSGSTWTLLIHSDAARTILVDTLTMTNASTETFRSVGCIGFGFGSYSQTVTGFVADMDVGEAAAGGLSIPVAMMEYRRRRT